MAVVEASQLPAEKLGYHGGLKPLQLKIVDAVVRGDDVFGILPTGYGKSLCYTCLPLVYDNLFGTAAVR
jgi:ATP-dependent DNA helicase RecQ